jgi:LmbE family N-acetylglucosaminyl deacetylase
MNIIVAPHPDDEILGAYSILVHQEKCLVVYVSDGNDEQRRATMAAAARFPTVDWEHVGLRENTLGDRLGTVISALTDILLHARHDYPGENISLYAPWEEDYHSDHRAVWDACRAACKPWRGLVRALYQMEIPSASPPGFRPNTYRIVDGPAKAEAFWTCYPGEMVASRGIAAVCALAMVRGAESGLVEAEAFRLVWRRV